MASLHHYMGVQFDQFMERRFGQLMERSQALGRVEARSEDPAPTPENNTPMAQHRDEAALTHEEEPENPEAENEPTRDQTLPILPQGLRVSTLRQWNVHPELWHLLAGRLGPATAGTRTSASAALPPPTAMPTPNTGIHAPQIQQDELPIEFKMPMKLPRYDSTKDPDDHLRAFHACMQIANLMEGTKCKLFPTTLTGEGLIWFSKLPNDIIHSFRDMENLFKKRFATSVVYKQPASVLADVHQEEHESLRDFIHKFNQKCLTINDLEDSVAVNAFQAGL